MNIGIPGHGLVDWAGGVDFLRMVIDSLQKAERGRGATLRLLVPDAGLRAAARRIYHAVKTLGRRTAGAERGQLRKAVEGLGIEVLPIAAGPAALEQAGRRLGLDVLLPSLFPLGPRFGIPWVGYVYDCQHRHLPQYFPAADIAWRDKLFARQLAEASAVIVNARAVQQDLLRFFPRHHARLFALPFAPSARSEWLSPPTGVALRHGIRGTYFLISNQFWVHKDHATAFAAFTRVAASWPDVTLVCTGGKYDSRDPAHFGRLVARLKADGMDERVKILGILPKAEQIELLRGARAVVQPSLFEGGPGGGAAYDAVALGVPLIAADTSVNREIDGAVEFFEAGSVDSLEAVLRRALSQVAPARSDAGLLERGREARARCGAVLFEAIDAAIASHRLQGA